MIKIDRKVRVIYADEKSSANDSELGRAARGWHLQEVDENGEAGEPLSLFIFSITFDIIKARHILEVKGDDRAWDSERDDDERPLSTDSSERISANLIHTTGALGGIKKLSLLGSSAPLKDEHMVLHVRLAKDKADEYFSVHASRGWKDWEYGERPPFLQIDISLKEENFRPLAEAVGANSVDSGRLHLSRIQGLYAKHTYAPIDFIDEIKILDRRDIEDVAIEGLEEGHEPLGLEMNAGEFDLWIDNYSDAEEDDTPEDYFEEESDWSADEGEAGPSADEVSQQLLLRLIQEQMAQREQITRLLAPLWLAVIALGVLIGIMWI